MVYYLYVYDCKRARETNARRVSFTKELYGFMYSWRTKGGYREKRKPGLLEECSGSVAVTASAILVPSEYRGAFEALFHSYQDILITKTFEVSRQLD
ncbi:MAG: hypothetical protein C4K47_03575 [Candidatus Thorarchaeota archaeon]|nr:MAG: hypothetical protein C4K47_03575 [Candidatus Thorarchaeota archaeon]